MTKEVPDIVAESIKVKTAYDLAEQSHKAALMQMMLDWLALQTDLAGNLRKPPPITPTQCLMLAEKTLDAFLRLVYKPASVITTTRNEQTKAEPPKE